MDAEDARSELEACLQENERLAEENDRLRQSATLFADLAERLNDRRGGADRREAMRAILDGRRTSVDADVPDLDGGQR